MARERATEPIGIFTTEAQQPERTHAEAQRHGGEGKGEIAGREERGLSRASSLPPIAGLRERARSHILRAAPLLLIFRVVRVFRGGLGVTCHLRASA